MLLSRLYSVYRGDGDSLAAHESKNLAPIYILFVSQHANRSASKAHEWGHTYRGRHSHHYCNNILPFGAREMGERESAMGNRGRGLSEGNKGGVSSSLLSSSSSLSFLLRQKLGAWVSVIIKGYGYTRLRDHRIVPKLYYFLHCFCVSGLVMNFFVRRCVYI